MITNCPVCGKAFYVQWPQLWRYKEGGVFICTWKCLRKIRKDQEEMERMKKDGTPAKKPGRKKTVQDLPVVKLSSPIKIETEEPDKVEANGPEVSLADAMTGMKDAADEFFGKCEDMGIRINNSDSDVVEVEVPTEAEISKPVNYDGFTIRAIQGTFGRYSYSQTRSAYIDFEDNDGNEMSMTVEQWRWFLRELHHAAHVLGVNL